MSKRRIFKQDEYRETGFGNRVVEENQRLMNKDGGSNVIRSGLPFYAVHKIYHELITMKWWKFITIIISSYLIVNLIFALIYFYCDLNHVNGMIYSTRFDEFMEVFFFSAQSLTTVGYGRLNPTGVIDSTIASIESLIGLLSFAIATGLLYGRFSRPVANILYSDNALIGPYKGFTAVMIRIANKSKSELIEPQAVLLMAYIEKADNTEVRKFISLKLELTKVTLLTMTWTIVHPIDEESPLYGWTESDYKQKRVEFMLLIQAYEETFAQTVHSRTSYTSDELVFGAKFTPVLKPKSDGAVIVELDKLNEYEIAPLHEEILLGSEA